MRTATPAIITAATLALAAATAGAGTIEGIVIEDKGIFQPTVPVTVFTSRMYIKLVSGWGPRDGEEHTRLNGERIVQIPAGPPVRVFNLYPVVIHVPQPGGFADPGAPIDFFSVMLVDAGNGLGGLPQGWQMPQATIEDAFGQNHNAQITPLNDLANLPTSSPNDTQIVWDLQDIPNRTGNFFLARYTMTADQAAPFLPGDTNNDGVVDLQDLNNVLNNFGDAAPSPGDDNHDGTVDLADLNNVLNNFGNSLSPPVSALTIPEPALSLVVIVPLARRRPRH